MALILKQSTAVDVLIGPFVDSTDGYTAETGLSPAVKLAKNGQALAAKNDATTPVHDADGYYNCELDATDTNTVGQLVLSVVGSATALPVRHEFYVIEEVIYDALFGTGSAAFDANGRIDIGKWLGTAVTTSSTTAKPEVDVFSVSDDAAAADNFELYWEGVPVNSGTLAGVGATSATLAASAVATTDYYNNALLIITSGTGVGQARVIDDYTSGRICTVQAWATQPTGAKYVVIPLGLAGMTIAEVEAAANPLPEKNVAFNDIQFLMVDETDFTTPETGLTVSGTRSLDSGAFAAVTGTIAEIANGMYQFDASAADMNGDMITFRFTATGAADRFLTIQTRS